MINLGNAKIPLIVIAGFGLLFTAYTGSIIPLIGTGLMLGISLALLWGKSSKEEPVLNSEIVCYNCKATLEEDAKFCASCGEPTTDEINLKRKPSREDTSAIKDSSGTVIAGSSQISALMNRYKDAYLYARVTVGVGSFIKWVGIGLGILLLLVALGTGKVIGTKPADSLMAGVIMGGIVGVFFYVWGILVSAVGQILKASLDGAVNSSPFLTNEHRAKIMSLPHA